MKVDKNMTSGGQDDKSLSTAIESKALGSSPFSAYGMSPLTGQENSALNADETMKSGMSMTQTMFERWHKANRHIPQVDRKNIFEENPNFNKNKKTCPANQHHPEYTQTSYLRIRATE